MLLPTELLKLAVPDPLKVTAPGDAAVTVNIGAGLALLTDGAISAVAAKAAATKIDLFMGFDRPKWRTQGLPCYRSIIVFIVSLVYVGHGYDCALPH